jgi:PTS system nitrogen regulatory IIA component
MNFQTADFSFDLILPTVKSGNAKQVMQTIAADITRVAGTPERILISEFTAQNNARSAALGRGVALFDIRTANLTQPFTVMARVAGRVDMNTPDGTDIDIVCIVMSPAGEGTPALQRLARWTRLLKNDDLLNALRAAQDADDIRITMSNPRTRLMAA